MRTTYSNFTIVSELYCKSLEAFSVNDSFFKKKNVLNLFPLFSLPADGFSVKVVKGMLYNPLFGSWSWTGNTSINYALHAIKLSMQEQQDLKEASTEHQQTEANIRTAS